MKYRVIAYSLGLAILIAVRFIALHSEGAKSSPPEEQDSAPSIWRLSLASFLVLFAELAFIRWIAVEVRVFAYFKNLALLLCFLGFGLGCALVSRRPRWSAAIKSLFGLLLVVRLPWVGPRALEGLSENLGAGADLHIWAAFPAHHLLDFLAAAALSALLFVLIVFVFVPLGQVVSRQMDLASSPLAAYSWNLAASLAGILVFLGMSRLMVPPWVWLGTVVIGIALLQRALKQKWITVSLIIPLALFLYEPATRDGFIRWTPYQQIEFQRRYTRDGEIIGGNVWVNHTGYQYIARMDADFLSRHPDLLKQPPDENPYNLAFRFAASSPSVLIVGSGTGNDVAGALRNGSSFVDAVEIDPAILDIGKREHPEHPYDSPRVSIHLTDARAFLKRTQKQYDVILFGLLDSHTQLSDYANMRIDNFVYTEESFGEAKAHLKPDGIIFVKFQVNRPWMSRRLEEILTKTFGKPPLAFLGQAFYTASGSCFVISPSDRVEQSLARDQRLAALVAAHPLKISDYSVPITTDDWPYLYQETKGIPLQYWSISIIIILLALVFYRGIPEAAQQRPSLFFFSMGVGFLLLETQVISRLALFFGTTWQVNGIVISAMLAALLLANVIVERCPWRIPPYVSLAGLLLGLVTAYIFPFDRIGDAPSVAGSIAVAVFSLPVVFAGILFSTEFHLAPSPGAALGANVLGAVVGGMLENLSLLFGMRALLLIAIAVYVVAGIGLQTLRRESASIRSTLALSRMG